jgi:hypothetical protein
MERTINEKTNQILEKYEDILLKNLVCYENGEEIKAETIQALNDSIRILHHIAQLRGYEPPGTSK